MSVEKNDNYQFVHPLKDWIKIPFNKSNPPRRVLFRVDAGQIYGLSYGHLSRCLIIEKAFKELFDTESLFLMKDFNDGVQHAILSGSNVKTLPDKEDQLFLQNIIMTYQPSCLVVDLPYQNEDFSFYLKIKKKFDIQFFFIDDNRYSNPGADIYLNTSMLANKKVNKINPDKTFYFLGPQYFIFDETLIDNTFPIPKNKYFNIVLSFGGADPTDLTIKVVRALLKISNKRIKYYVILGPGYSKQDSLYQLIHDACNFSVICNPKNIIPFFYSCDFVICAGGRTMYELLYLNKQFMPIASTPQEALAISTILENNLIENGMLKWSTKKFINIMININNV